jgi:hypothetical protein
MDEFKLIVAGGRDFDDYNKLSSELLALALGQYADKAVSIVSGMARGADLLAVRFAKEHGVKVYPFVPDWNGPLGKGAGFARNKDMGNFADGLLAFWDGKSRGTKQMIEYMRSLNKPTKVCRY